MPAMDDCPPLPKNCARPVWLLRPADQSALAVLVCAALMAIGAWLILPVGNGNGLAEADRAPRLSARFLVDVNAADQGELLQLPGVGEVLSRRIIERRQTYGPFATPEDLRGVKGIGVKTLEHLRPYLAPLPKEKKPRAEGLGIGD
jgi:competence ComEA-like helix-hairpin-helix protein